MLDDEPTIKEFPLKPFLASSLLAISLMGATAAPASAPAGVPKRPGSCARTYTVAMAARAARATYRGTRKVTRRDLRHLAMYLRCQRNPYGKKYVRWFYKRQHYLWVQRRKAAEWPHMDQAIASWYDDGGETACGFHAYYGVANRDLPCGTKVLICYPWYSHSNCVKSYVQDRGPYANNADWDLNQNVAGALGFDGVDTVGVHVY